MTARSWSGVRDPQRRARMAAGVTRPPLPLDQAEALEQALELRERDLSYNAIATIMGVYHGHWATAAAWMSRCRNAGAPVRWPGRETHLPAVRRKEAA